MIVLLAVMSVFAFVVIQLPPGDYLTSYIANLQQQMGQVDDSVILSLRQQYGLDKPMWQQYFLWMGNMLKGDFGQSFQWKQPVGTLIATRMPMTIALSVITLVFVHTGIYRPCDTQLFPGTDTDVLQQQIFRAECRRLLFAGISKCAMELCTALGFVQAPSHSGNRYRPGKYGQCDPYPEGHASG